MEIHGNTECCDELQAFKKSWSLAGAILEHIQAVAIVRDSRLWEFGFWWSTGKASCHEKKFGMWISRVSGPDVNGHPRKDF